MSKSRTIASHGRGGAGNIGPTIFDDDKANLITPTIKSDTYTTGRGGSGNMKKNDLDHPEEARRSQDVNPAIQQDSKGPTHTGRGGAANIAHPSIEGVAAVGDEVVTAKNGERSRS